MTLFRLECKRVNRSWKNSTSIIRTIPFAAEAATDFACDTLDLSLAKFMAHFLVGAMDGSVALCSILAKAKVLQGQSLAGCDGDRPHCLLPANCELRMTCE